MSYIGNPIISTDFPKDTFSGNGATVAFTMSIAPASVNAVIVVVSGITQDPSTYTISGTTLTFSAAPPTGTSNISVRHLGVAGIPNTPSAGSVGLTALSATGTKDSTTFLRGDNTFAVPPAGAILQLVSTNKTDTFSTTSGSYTDVTGLSVSITPQSATSKIFVIVHFNTSGAQTANESFRLMKDATALSDPFAVVRIGQDAQAEYQVTNIAYSYLDSPATTSSTTYKIQAKTNYSTLYVNRPLNQGGFSDTLKSTITVMEVAV